MTQSDPRRGRKPAVPSAIEQQIDENLKRLYQQQLQDELPESLKALVARLRNEGPQS